MGTFYNLISLYLFVSDLLCRFPATLYLQFRIDSNDIIGNPSNRYTERKNNVQFD